MLLKLSDIAHRKRTNRLDVIRPSPDYDEIGAYFKTAISILRSL